MFKILYILLSYGDAMSQDVKIGSSVVCLNMHSSEGMAVVIGLAKESPSILKHAAFKLDHKFLFLIEDGQGEMIMLSAQGDDTFSQAIEIAHQKAKMIGGASQWQFVPHDETGRGQSVLARLQPSIGNS